MKKIKSISIYFFFAALFVASSAFAEIYQFGIIGDAGKWNDNAKSVRDSIAGLQVDHLILPGDNLYDGNNYDEVWDHWLKHDLKLQIVAIGNHNAGYKKEVKYFEMPGEYYSKVTQNGKALFIVLNSDNVDTSLEQAKWLEETLAKAEQSFIFVIFHHPPFTLSPNHPWKEREKFHIAIWPILAKYRQKLSGLLLGHDHMASFLTFDTLPVIVSGAVMETRPPLAVDYKAKNGVAVKTRWIYDQTPQWVKLDIDFTQKTWTASFIKGSDSSVQCSVTMTARSKKALMAPSCSKGMRR